MTVTVECELFGPQTICMGAVLRAEIERLLGVCKDKTTLLKVAYADNERLTAALQQIADDATPGDDNYCSDLARRALEPKP